MKNKQLKPNLMSRRQFLKDGLLTVGLAVISPMVLLDSCKNSEKGAERSATGPAATPGITATGSIPEVSQTGSIPDTSDAGSSPDAYVLTVGGFVDNPLTLNYNSILQFTPVTKTVELTCPGVFEETAEWTGVPLMSILVVAGIKPQATQVVVTDATGYGAPFSVQEEAITSGDIMLAFKYNGQGLPADRGYPIRLVVPGTEGTAWVKGVTQVKVM